jgi:hypothetical protein
MYRTVRERGVALEAEKGFQVIIAKTITAKTITAK